MKNQTTKKQAGAVFGDLAEVMERAERLASKKKNYIKGAFTRRLALIVQQMSELTAHRNEQAKTKHVLTEQGKAA